VFTPTSAAGGLAEGKQVPHAVVEECAEFTGPLARIVARDDDHLGGCNEAGDVDALERHAAGSSEMTAARSATSKRISVELPDASPVERNR
jgi:hypothetical protein